MNGIQLSFAKNSFKDTKLNNFNIKETWFQVNSFESTQMKNGVFENITFINSYFPDADLQGTEFINLNASPAWCQSAGDKTDYNIRCN